MLPAALRRAMIRKFPDFDEYQVSRFFCSLCAHIVQLGKYNKESKPKKKPEKQVTREHSSKSEDEEEIEKMTFSLKQACLAALDIPNLGIFLLLSLASPFNASLRS
jgi:hypothetical protein